MAPRPAPALARSCRAALLLVLAPCLALADDDLDALNIAAQVPSVVAGARNWQAFSEMALGQYGVHDTAVRGNSARLSLDLQLDAALAPGWRLMLSDRLDVIREDLPDKRKSINTLKEAWLSWQANPDQSLDLGRINARYGVSAGYNPSDFFRTGSVRSFITVDPASLKKNRLGSVMLRAQQLWQGGSVTAIISPKLGQLEGDADGNGDLDGTNRTHRYMLSASTRLFDNVEPQWMLYGEAGKPVQLGFNLSMLATNATVAYLEWSGGRTPDSLASALGQDQTSRFHHRAAAGVSHTSAHKLTLTGEFQFNGAGMDDAAWDALPRTAPQQYLRYRQWLQSAQELPTRRSLFFHATWQDVMKSGVDLNAMVRRNLSDRSDLVWFEARRNWASHDLALQWQRNSGVRGSEFGSMPQKSAWQAVFRKYF